NLKRLDKAFQNFFKEKRGYPRFKTRQKFRSFNYASGQVTIEGDRVHLPRIGWMRFYLSRPMTDGFSIKTVTIRKKSDGWYMSVTLEDKSVPAPMPIDSNQVKRAIGVDLGIKKLASLSQGSIIPNPQFYKQVERRRTIRYRAASRKQKGSRNKSKAYQYLARLEQKVANRRTHYQWKVANKLCNLADAIIFEDLNIKGMMARCKPLQNEAGKYLTNGQSKKRGLNRVIADASWGELKQKVKSVAEKFGCIVLEVNPRHTSVTCYQCGCVSKDNRNGERFGSTECGYIEDADIQASKNILERGLKLLGIDLSQLCGVPAKVMPEITIEEISLPWGGEPGNPRQSGGTDKQLSVQNQALYP
ncbi:MAG: RNA-guided endonuclease InsQ/TnpB family protein, partial [Xenococcaceae cyanobacterium]